MKGTMNARALKILAATKLLPLLLLLTQPSLVQAQFTFTTNSGAITITGYNTAAGLNAIIPAATNGYPVTSIGFAAFQYLGITNVSIPNRVTSIGSDAFLVCTSLKSVTIPDSVTSIGVDVFTECSVLTGVTIGTGLTNIGYDAFSECSSLTNFTVDASNTAYASSSGVLFDKAQATLIQFPAGLGGGYIIPNSVTNIGKEAFRACTNLTNVTIPNSVTGIGDYAFEFCALRSVTISNSVTSIGNYAFYYCSSLTSVTITNSFASVGDAAFADCYSLTNVNIETGVTSIGDYAFESCALTSVTIPNSVTDIGDGAFYGCSSLANFSVNASNPAYSSLGGVLLDKAQATLIQFPAGLGGSYTIPNGVTSIGNYAFNDCSSLTSVTIPNSVTSIGDDAFGYCSSLTSVTIGTGVTSIGVDAFDYCNNLTSVTIPNSVTNIGDGAFFYCALTSAYFQGNAPPDDGTAFIGDSLAIAYYLPGTTGWGSTFGSVPAVLWNPQANTPGVTGGHFGFSLTGPTNTVIVVEACTNLSNPVWLPVSTNTLSGSGTSPFSDPQSGNYSKRFYRFRSP
jgi:BspA type Leucine rich repeat region (6 copies)